MDSSFHWNIHLYIHGQNLPQVILEEDFRKGGQIFDKSRRIRKIDVTPEFLGRFRPFF